MPSFVNDCKYSVEAGNLREHELVQRNEVSERFGWRLSPVKKTELESHLSVMETVDRSVNL